MKIENIESVLSYNSLSGDKRKEYLNKALNLFKRAASRVKEGWKIDHVVEDLKTELKQTGSVELSLLDDLKPLIDENDPGQTKLMNYLWENNNLNKSAANYPHHHFE